MKEKMDLAASNDGMKKYSQQIGYMIISSTMSEDQYDEYRDSD